MGGVRQCQRQHTEADPERWGHGMEINRIGVE